MKKRAIFILLFLQTRLETEASRLPVFFATAYEGTPSEKSG